MGLLYQLASKRKEFFLLAQEARLLEHIEALIEEDEGAAKQLNMLAEKLAHFSPLIEVD